jgi:hypothetical protein
MRGNLPQQSHRQPAVSDFQIGHATARPAQFNACYDPETVQVMKAVLDDAWASLVPVQQARITKSDMACRILEAVADGERDPVRLRACALIALATEHYVR